MYAPASTSDAAVNRSCGTWTTGGNSVAPPDREVDSQEVLMRKWLGGIAVVLATSAAPALAHHPFAAEYDWKKPATVTGTVTKFNWENPHSMIAVKGKDDRGTEAEWMVELAG